MPAKPKPMTEAQARAAVAAISRRHDDLVAVIQRAYDGQAWKALGYHNWGVLCAAEFPDMRLPQPVKQQLRSAGMSTRAIAAVSGASKTTVARTTVPNGTVVGLDGRTTRSPDRRLPPADDPMDDIAERLGFVRIELDRLAGDICDMDPTVVAANETVVLRMQTITTIVRVAFGPFVTVVVDA